MPTMTLHNATNFDTYGDELEDRIADDGYTVQNSQSTGFFFGTSTYRPPSDVPAYYELDGFFIAGNNLTYSFGFPFSGTVTNITVGEGILSGSQYTTETAARTQYGAEVSISDMSLPVADLLDMIASGDFAAEFRAYVEQQHWTINGSGGNDKFFGGVSADTLYGNAGIDTIEAGGGNDVLDGGTGADILQGGAGNDSYVVDNANDVVDESPAGSSGTDSVISSITWSLTDTVHTKGFVEVVQLTGAANVNAYGNSLANLLVGNNGANVLDGRAGADFMQGRGGSDTYVVDNAGDVVDESAAGSSGSDAIISSVSWGLANAVHTKGFVEVLQLTGSTAINAYGNSLANLLVGNAGANLLSGAAGNDVLIGGAGRDLFYFNTVPNSTANVDTIADFSVADDTIWLENAVYAALGPAGPLAASAFAIGGAAADASDRIVYNSSTGALSYDDDGTGVHGAVIFAKVAAGLALTAADFTVV
jgi:Ca2+-binding RTX toxin-like protein